MSTPHASDALLRLLDAFDDRPEAAILRARSYDLLLPGPGLASASIVDVGCGAGRAVGELAERGVRAIGLDHNERMVAVARDRRPDADLRVGDALDLPFEDGELTGYRADKVLHIIPSPEKAVAEAHRVLAPGGRAVLTGHDWDGIMIDSDHPDLTRRIVRSRADLAASPRAARRHRNLLLDAGFVDVSIEARLAVFTDDLALALVSGQANDCLKANAITEAESEIWLAEQHDRARTDRLFLAIPFFIAAGTRT